MRVRDGQDESPELMNNILPENEGQDDVLQVLIKDINDLEGMFHHLGLDVSNKAGEKSRNNEPVQEINKPRNNIYSYNPENSLRLLNQLPGVSQQTPEPRETDLTLAPGDTRVNLRMKKRHLVPRFSKMSPNPPMQFPAEFINQIIQKDGLHVFRM